MIAYTRLPALRPSLPGNTSAQLLLPAGFGPACAASGPGLTGMDVTAGTVIAAEHIEKGATPVGGRGVIALLWTTWLRRQAKPFLIVICNSYLNTGAAGAAPWP